jgi:uncharacterized protein YjiS (DUF1127 family)
MNAAHIAAALEQTTASTWRASNVIRSCWGGFQERRKRQRLLADLCSLNDRELADIGITRGEIDCVVLRPLIDPRGI